MSGGVGPTGNDISLPKDDEARPTAPATSGKSAGFLSFRQLNALAVMIVLSASGMISPEDFAFVIFSVIYVYFLSKIAFPTLNFPSEPPVFDPKNRTLRLYVWAAAIIGLFLPIAYIFEGIFEGDKEGIRAAAPHVFLLSSQVYMEGLVFSHRFSTPLRVFVPVFYNSRRIFTLVDWLKSEIYKVEDEDGGSTRRLHVGRALAAVNMALWCFNLFGFLLPFYLPKAFKKYYTGFKVKD